MQIKVKLNKTISKWSIIILLSPVFCQVLINEYSASNLSWYTDNYQLEEDWIELYNTNSTEEDIGGYFLSDDPDEPAKWMIPGGTVIPADGYLVFWCSGRDEYSENHFHTNFKLKQSKNNPDHVVISDPSGDIIDDIEMFKTQLNHSMGRSPNGSETWGIFGHPTLGDENSEPSYTAYAAAPVMSLEAGFYNGTQSLEIYTDEPDATIRYTTNGEKPFFGSTVYSDLISISSTQVVKAIVFTEDPSILPSFITFNTFFIDEDHSLPVLSTSANQLTTMLNGNQTLRPHGSIEYFDIDGSREDYGYGEYNKHGQDSWAFPQRSFDYIARDEMGYHDAIREKLLSLSDRDEFQRIIIRASGDDNYPGIDSSAHMRDIFIHKFANKNNMKLDMRKGERCVVYANGQFWGIYSIREKVSDSDYTEYYYGQDKYNIQYVMNWGNTWAQYGGSDAITAWNTTRNYATSHDLSIQSNYEHVEREIDVTSLVDYILINSFVVCTDWINWNTSVWRGLDPNGTHKKWGFVLWDEDATFNHYINYTDVPNENPNAEPCYPEEIYMDPLGVIDILNALLENEEFTQYYYTRYMDLLNTAFIEDDMIELLEGIENSIAPDMPQHINRWGGSMFQWRSNVAKIKNFISDRVNYLPEGLNSCYDLSGPYEITLDVEPINTGQIAFNSLTIESDDYPWSGNYHGGIDMLVEATGNYPFDHWEIDNHGISDPYMPSFTLLLSQSDNIRGVYSSEITPGIVINEINYNSSDDFDPEDWVELYNSSESPINIGTWKLKDEANDHVFIIPENTILAGGDYLVLCKDTIAFTSLFPGVSNFIGDLGFGLGGGGDMVRLFDSYDILMDDVEYDDDDPWPIEADGTGATLELIDPSLDNSLPENWIASIGYGSPGSENLMNSCEESLGDINGDGTFDVLDVILLMNIILTVGNDYTICQEGASDLNSDGVIDILDVVLLINIILEP